MKPGNFCFLSFCFMLEWILGNHVYFFKPACIIDVILCISLQFFIFGFCRRCCISVHIFFYFGYAAHCWFQADALFSINECLSGLYHEGLFIKASRAEFLAKKGLGFLRKYAKLALDCYRARKRRLPFIPKGHFLHHQFLGMLQEAQRGPWCFNVLAFANQQSEDFVGRPSRLSRRVSSRTAPLRVIQRTFLAIKAIVLEQD